MKSFALIICLACFLVIATEGRSQVNSGGSISYSETLFPRTFDPITGQIEMANVRLTTLLFEGLFGLTMDRDVTKQLAESYMIASDQKHITVSLKRGIKWSDGAELSAADVGATVSAMKKSSNPLVRRMVGDIADVLEVNATTVAFTFSQSFPSDVLVKKLLFKVLPAHKLQQLPLTNQSDIAKRPVGTGYYVCGARGATQLTLKANPYYRGRTSAADGPLIDEIAAIEIPSVGSQIENLKNDRIDVVLEIPPTSIPELRSVGFQLKSYDALSFTFIAFNFKNSILKNRSVRQAMTIGFNRDNALTKIYQRQGTVISGPFPASSLFNARDVEPFTYDPALASAILDSAGYYRSGTDGIRHAPDGNRLQFEFVVPRYPGGSADYSPRVFNQFISDMKSIGIAIKFSEEEKDNWKERVLERQEFELAYAELTFDETDDISPLFHSKGSLQGGSNFISYSSAEVDNLLDKAHETLNPDLKLNANRRLHRLLHDDCPYLFLFSLKKTAAARGRVRNFVTTVTPFSFFDYANKWYIQE